MSNKPCTVEDCTTPVGAKGAKGYCPHHYRRHLKYGDPTYYIPTYTECATPGCTKAPRSARATLCTKHYHRQYRHGSVHAVSIGVELSTAPKKYKSKYDPTHPLAMKNGKVYVHRAMLFDNIGEDEQSCHWCETKLHWFANEEQEALHVDHLDGDRLHNHPDNLAPSCNACNSGRAMQARSKRLRELGFWSNNDTIAELSRGRRESIVEDQLLLFG